MAFCPNCGVELAASSKYCPLCGAAAGSGTVEVAECGESEGAAKRDRRSTDSDNPENLTQAERRKIAWELVSVSTAIAAAAVCAANLLADHRLSWALYPLASLTMIWAIVTITLMLGKRPLIAAAIGACIPPLFLTAIDAFDGRLSWALPVALPIAMVAEFSAAAAVFSGVKAKRKGVNLIAFAVLAVTATCIGIETTLNLFLRHSFTLVWSAIVAAALVPVAIFLLYLHHRVTKKSNLRKLFRL
jgi:uncharacterized membrane protein